MIWLFLLCIVMVIVTRCVPGKTMAKILLFGAALGMAVLFFSFYTIQVVPR